MVVFFATVLYNNITIMDYDVLITVLSYLFIYF
jgi:hypothetical protein